MARYVSSDVALSPVFGPVGDQREAVFRRSLLEIDEALHGIAEDATRHVGQRFAHWPLQLFEEVREISGGASADVGDIWFEIVASGPNRWEISASIPVHCDLMPRGYSCTHDLFDEHRMAESAEDAINALAALVAEVRTELPRIPVAKFHQFPHAAFGQG